MFDLLIKNGTVLDGSGQEGFLADVAVKDGKIAAIGTDLGDAAQVLDATGLTVTPGFIDSHSHADSAILTLPLQKEKIEQGITTNIGGQCGGSASPAVRDGKLEKMSEFFAQGTQIPQGSNIATFVGHSTIRKAVMGMENRPATPEELAQMEDLLRDAMDAGTVGLSFGLYYTPGAYAPLEELIALAKIVGEKKGLLSAHMRNENGLVVEGLKEYLTIIKASGARAIVSHHKSTTAAGHGKVNITIPMMEQANREGCDIFCDVYPYIASHTSLAPTLLPKAYVNGKVSEHMKDPALRQYFREYGFAQRGDDDLSWVQLTICTAFPQYSGLRLNEAAKLHGKDSWETLFDILEQQPGCTACYFTMREEDVERVLSWERSMVCTDSGVAGSRTFYHPRLRGSFPRVLGRYVRERNVTSLPEMIRKMTSLPAYVYGLEGKGYLRVGMDADICVFDPATILDHADYMEPTLGAEGLKWVIVNGQIAAENAQATGVAAGKVLLRRP